jgi:hypothetical protein
LVVFVVVAAVVAATAGAARTLRAMAEAIRRFMCGSPRKIGSN